MLLKLYGNFIKFCVAYSMESTKQDGETLLQNNK